MKLAVKDIVGFLKAPTQTSAVLIYGPDRGQIRQNAATIAAQIVPADQDAFNRTELSPDAVMDDPALLADELSAMSLMGGRRLICLYDAPEKIASAIESAMEMLHEGNYLIVTADELGPRSPLRLLFESKKTLAALPCYKDEGMQLSQLIRETLKKYNINANQDIFAYLTDNLGGDRQIILNEIEKLALYAHGQPTLELEEVQAVIKGSNEHNLDDLCQAVASGHITTVCHTWDRLSSEGVQEVMVLRSLGRYFSRLSEVHQSVASGMAVTQAIKQLRPAVFFKQEPAFKRHLERWRPALLEAAQRRLAEAERDAKLGGELSATICGQHLLSIAKAAG